ncbi:MAG: hypothetical protein BMS9Abin31_0520 [Gammaproteobacteria bacterium]|nr:MAG: hypothetical protein BMS9Abin31_0520 [Gammaproteobacteria bacterium]
MKKISRLIFIVLLSSFSFNAGSQELSAMKQFIQKQVMAMCDDKAFLSCIGMSKKKCAKVTIKSLSECDRLLPKDMTGNNADAAMNAHGQCLTKRLLKNSGVSEQKLDSCESTGADSAESMDSSEALAMMSQAFQHHAQTIGTDRVTLPIYNNTTVMSHMTESQMKQMLNESALPALTLVSSDNVRKIATYYRSKLKGFREYKVQDGTLFLKNGPKDFDMVRDFKKMYSTPGVIITAIQDYPSTPPGTKSQIGIAYQK